MQALSDNTIYYVLSTIAQCVAALFAFLGAFVLFRLQSSDQRLRELAAALANATTRAGRRGQLELLISGRQYKDALIALSHAAGHDGVIGHNYGALEAELSQLDAIRRTFVNMLWPTLCIIAAAVLGIALVDQLKAYQPITFALVGLLFIGFVFVMWRMAVVMRRCLGFV